MKHETCLCEFGKIGREKKKEANEKRRAFYNYNSLNFQLSLFENDDKHLT
jgi:hypothetical protein